MALGRKARHSASGWSLSRRTGAFGSEVIIPLGRGNLEEVAANSPQARLCTMSVPDRSWGTGQGRNGFVGWAAVRVVSGPEHYSVHDRLYRQGPGYRDCHEEDEVPIHGICQTSELSKNDGWAGLSVHAATLTVRTRVRTDYKAGMILQERRHRSGRLGGNGNSGMFPGYCKMGQGRVDAELAGAKVVEADSRTSWNPLAA